MGAEQNNQSVLTELEKGGKYAIQISKDGETIIVPNPLTPREILKHGEKVTRMENIEISKIVRDGNTIIDKVHAEKMAQSLLQDGQQNTILVRARFNKEGEIVYDIVDGFHRFEGACFTKGKIGTLRAVVKYNFSDEWLYDQRVMAANSVRTIQFPRIITWITDSFKESPWYKEKRLSITQVTASVFSERVRKELKLTNSEGEEIKKWVNQKCITWNLSIKNMYNMFLAVENADAKLVNAVRWGKGGGHEGKGIFNEHRFKETVKCLPRMFKFQWLMYNLIKDFDLVTTEIPIVAEAMLEAENRKGLLKKLISNPRNTQLLSEVTKKSIGTIKGKVTYLTEKEIVSGSEDPVLLGLDSEEILAIDEKDPFQIKVPDSLRFNKKTLTRKAHYKPSNSADDYIPIKTPQEYQREIEDLRNSLAIANNKLTKKGSSKEIVWFETLANLTQKEREVLRFIYTLRKETKLHQEQIDQRTMKEFGLTEPQLDQIKKSAIAKLRIHFEDIVNAEYDEIV